MLRGGLLRSVQRLKRARTSAGLERFVCTSNLSIDLCGEFLRFAHEGLNPLQIVLVLRPNFLSYDG